MREALIILPIQGNDGTDLSAAHAALAKDICRTFGGATISEARGMWIDPTGRLFDEPVRQYAVACEDNAASVAALRGMADGIGRVARQQSMYLRLPSGDVEIREIAPLEIAA